MSTKIALFASGSGSNAENIIRYFQGNKQVEFPFILSNNSKAYVHDRAKALSVPSLTFTKDEFVSGEKIIRVLKNYNIDLIVLAGFMIKVPQNMIIAYPDRIINIHPALLPKFGGKGMFGEHVHKAVVEAGETKSGITIHYVNENYDEGNVIFQAECEISPSDTYVDVAAKVHALEYEYYPKIIENILGKIV
jgi:phosphoribosylglycinamide formyltransferase 1